MCTPMLCNGTQQASPHQLESDDVSLRDVDVAPLCSIAEANATYMLATSMLGLYCPYCPSDILDIISAGTQVLRAGSQYLQTRFMQLP